MSTLSDVNAMQYVGLPIILSSGIFAAPDLIVSAAFMMRRVAFRYPSSPSVTIAAQVDALIPSERLPATVGDAYKPPCQSVIAKYMRRRNARLRKSTTDAPFSP